MSGAASLWLMLASAYGFLAVALGAFGAHGLRNKLSPELMAVYRTAVEYHFTHALALLAVALLVQRVSGTWINVAGVGFSLGILLFSGSLYVLALSGIRWLGAITPLGGLLFLLGWAALFVVAWQHGTRG